MSDLVVLMGYMGSGKSTVGAVLANQLNSNFIDLDAFIEKVESLSVSEIFESKGALYFRKKEKEALEQILSSEKNIILAVGGGTPCYYDNMDLIKQKSTSIYLKASVKELSQRLFMNKDKRPLLKNINDVTEMQEFIGKHLFERSPTYNMANYSVTTDGSDVDTVIENCLKILT